MKKNSTIKILLIVTMLVCWAGGVSVKGANLDNRMIQDLRNLARSVFDQGGPDRAIGLLMRHKDDPRILSLILEYSIKAGFENEFVDVAAQQAALQPADIDVQDVYLRSLYTAGMRDSIMPVAARIIEVFPDSANVVWLKIGRALSDFGMWANALEVYQRGRAAVGDEQAFSREVALALVELGRIRDAVDQLLVMTAVDPSSSGKQKEVAYRIAGLGDEATELLLERLEKSLDKAGKEVAASLHLLLMDLYISKGHAEDAYRHLAILLRGLDRRGGQQLAQVYIGRAVKLMEYDSALAAYALADTLGLMTHESSVLGRAELFIKMEKYLEAEQCYQEISRSRAKPLAAMAWKKLGDLYLNFLDRPGEALTYYRRLEKSGGLDKTQLIEAKLLITENFIRLRRLDEAGELCRELLTAEDADPVETSGAILLLGDILFFSGQPDSSAEMYFNFSRMNLGDERANDAMGKLYLIRHDRGVNHEAAIAVGKALFAARTGDVQSASKILSGVISSHPDSLYRAQVFYQMGRMYEQEGEFTLALGAYGQLAEEFPSSQLAPLAELRMGIVLLEEVGDSAGAKKYFERVVFEYPKGVATSQARRLLRTIGDEKL